MSTQLSVSGNAGFTGPISFSCTGLPQLATCSFNPGTVTVSGTASVVTLTVNTAATAAAAVDTLVPGRELAVVACGVPLPGLLLLLPFNRRRAALLCALLVLLPLAAISGCGGGSGSSAHPASVAAGTYSFQVVSTSGSTSVSTPLQLTVQ